MDPRHLCPMASQERGTDRVSLLTIVDAGEAGFYLSLNAHWIDGWLGAHSDWTDCRGCFRSWFLAELPICSHPSCDCLAFVILLAGSMQAHFRWRRETRKTFPTDFAPLSKSFLGPIRRFPASRFISAFEQCQYLTEGSQSRCRVRMQTSDSPSLRVE